MSLSASEACSAARFSHFKASASSPRPHSVTEVDNAQWTSSSSSSLGDGIGLSAIVFVPAKPTIARYHDSWWFVSVDRRACDDENEDEKSSRPMPWTRLRRERLGRIESVSSCRVVAANKHPWRKEADQRPLPRNSPASRSSRRMRTSDDTTDHCRVNARSSNMPSHS